VAEQDVFEAGRAVQWRGVPCKKAPYRAIILEHRATAFALTEMSREFGC
jgi:hypothetical protein